MTTGSPHPGPGQRPSLRSRRRGFTLTECTIALVVLTAMSVMVAELATRMLLDRSRLSARFEAEQIATNVLEQARSISWDELTPAWASDRKLPKEILNRWPNTKLVVRIEAEPNRPRVKRITVEIQWEGDKLTKWPAVTMTALFAARTVGGST